MKKIQELRKQEAKIRNDIHAIEQKEVEKVQIPRLKAMVGQCYAYRKISYSYTKKANDCWDVFRKILEWYESKEEGFYFIVEEFQVDSQGKVNWEIESHAPYLNKEWWNVDVPFYGYEKISEREYESEKLKMVGEMALRTKMKKFLNTKD